MSYITVYTRKVKRRATGIVVTEGCAYETKTHTDMHAHLRAKYPDAQTWTDAKRVYTDFVPGMNLGFRPIVSGGYMVAGAAK